MVTPVTVMPMMQKTVLMVTVEREALRDTGIPDRSAAGATGHRHPPPVPTRSPGA